MENAVQKVPRRMLKRDMQQRFFFNFEQKKFWGFFVFILCFVGPFILILSSFLIFVGFLIIVFDFCGAFFICSPKALCLDSL